MKRLTYLMSALLIVFALGACEQQEVAPDASIQDELSKMNGKKVMNFRAHLSGDNEVPPVDTDATGQAIFQYKDGMLHFKLIVANIDDIFMAHIHMAPAGQNGGVVAWLYPPDGPPPSLIDGKSNGILAEGEISEEDLKGSLEGKELMALIAAMKAGNTYVNVHTSSFGGGEVRGQIF